MPNDHYVTTTIASVESRTAKSGQLYLMWSLRLDNDPTGLSVPLATPLQPTQVRLGELIRAARPVDHLKVRGFMGEALRSRGGNA
jgi:hypothetical protein